jgi:ubiquinone/menaquinone biosynthesis C-methylase UbiE
MSDVVGRIAARFNELSSDQKLLPLDASSDDYRLNAVLSFLGGVRGKFILDVGCAKGRFSRIFVEQGARVVGIDIADELVRVASRNVPEARFGVSNATGLPFPDGQFDAVVCIDVLEHIPDTEQAIREMIRVLKPLGRVVVVDKNILSLEPKFLLPTALWKTALEISNRWMYPRGFPFREKYFTAWQVDDLLSRHGCNSTYSFLIRPYRRFKVRGLIFSAFPFLSFYIAWKGIKEEL